MKCGFRLILCAVVALLVPFYLLKVHLEDLCNQYRAGAYLIDWLNYNDPHDAANSHHDPPGDKVIVMAKLEEENTQWVEEELPEYSPLQDSICVRLTDFLSSHSWQRAIYIVNPSRASAQDDHALKTPLNKGHESMAYLTYLIDHYDSLPSTIAFLHAHRAGFFMAWHVDAPMHDNVLAMQSLQLDYVQQNGYVNLRCNWNPGCKAEHRINSHVTEGVWEEIFEDTSTPPLNSTTSIIGESSDYSETQKFLKTPKEVAAACCAQFAISRDQVLERPREDYIKIRQWIIDTDKDDASSGRVMEFLWHVIFGRESVYCPDEELCYCQVYGKC
ncbi:hypothetical protein FE257_009056 [Aspergillus nanangensis]|uniref:Uncharacterized protein n=1 Tax=Aspergillus nanangensis TaxID=2582783 RepID=A0AAD4CX46_ASPNN|nr:hypothetical protein FE257_009056 [Aspergillus nanangensis]